MKTLTDVQLANATAGAPVKQVAYRWAARAQLAQDTQDYEKLTAALKRLLPEVAVCDNPLRVEDGTDQVNQGCGPFVVFDDDCCCVDCGGDVSFVSFDTALEAMV